MRKSNIIILVVMAFLSFELFWLWNYLGFSLTDPLDFVIVIIWWVVILGGCLAIVLSGRRRKQLMRTIFISDGYLYNVEAGLVRIDGEHEPGDYARAIRSLLSSLKYGSIATVGKDRPDVRFKYIVYTNRFSRDGSVWNGEVVSVIGDNEPKPFSSEQELSELLAN